MPLAARFAHDGQVILLQAQLALADGKLEPARMAFERALALDANDAATWSTLGHVRAQLGRLAEAVTAFEVALRLSPNLPAAVLGLAQVVHDQGDLGRAQREAERALTLSSRGDQREALALLAAIRHQNREPLVVSNLVKRARAITTPALDPSSTRRLGVQLARLEAEASLMRDDAAAALTVLEAAIQAFPREPELEALTLEARLRKARGRQRRSLLSDLAKPATAPMQLLAARVALAEGRAAEAVPLLQRVLQARLKDRAAPRLLAETGAELALALLASSQTEAAASQLKAALAQSPRSALVHLAQSLVLEAQGKASLADGELDQAAALQPRLPEVQFYLAQRHLRRRNLPAARAALRAHVELDPAGPLAAAAREQLKKL
jgi:tetratricopeptide (TPR) repeat protein